MVSFIYEEQLLNQTITLIGESLFFLLVLMYLNINNTKVFDLVTKALPKTFKSNISIYVFDLFFVSSFLIYLHGKLLLFFNENNFYLFPKLFNNIFPVITLISVIVISDFIGYWRHRFEHSALIRPFHAMHHSDNDMSWFTIYRFHPINRLTTSIIDISALTIIGFPAWAIGINVVIRHYYGMFCHAKVTYEYGKLNYIFISPTHHQWHHVAQGKGISSNYSTIFSFWDLLFNTFYLPGKCDEELGIRNTDNNSFIKQMLYPFVYLFKYFKKFKS